MYGDESNSFVQTQVHSKWFRQQFSQQFLQPHFSSSILSHSMSFASPRHLSKTENLKAGTTRYRSSSPPITAPIVPLEAVCVPKLRPSVNPELAEIHPDSGAYIEILQVVLAPSGGQTEKSWVNKVHILEIGEEISVSKSFKLVQTQSESEGQKYMTVSYNQVIPSADPALTPLNYQDFQMLKQAFVENTLAKTYVKAQERKRVMVRRVQYNNRKRGSIKSAVFKYHQSSQKKLTEEQEKVLQRAKELKKARLQRKFDSPRKSLKKRKQKVILPRDYGKFKMDYQNIPSDKTYVTISQLSRPSVQSDGSFQAQQDKRLSLKQMLLTQMTRRDQAKGEKRSFIQPPVMSQNNTSYKKYTGESDFTSEIPSNRPSLTIDVDKVNQRKEKSFLNTQTNKSPSLSSQGRNSSRQKKSPLITPRSGRKKGEILSPMDSYVKKTPRGGQYYSTLVASQNEEEEADLSMFEFKSVQRGLERNKGKAVRASPRPQNSARRKVSPRPPRAGEDGSSFSNRKLLELLGNREIVKGLRMLGAMSQHFGQG